MIFIFIFPFFRSIEYFAIIRVIILIANEVIQIIKKKTHFSLIFQTQCASLRVTDCNQLLREASREAILRDDVCTAQCGFVLAATESSARLQFTTPSSSGFPGFPPQTNNLRSSPTPASFNGFKLPDLSQFIG